MESHKITKTQLLALLREFGSSSTEWVTVYLRPETIKSRPARLVLQDKVDLRLVEIASLIEDDQLQREMERYGTGLSLFYSGASALALVSPFAVQDDLVTIGPPHVGPLREQLERPRRTALLLVTWGAYVVALYDGDSLVHYKKGTGHIHPPHKKGGSSQARFARRTENQRAEFLRRVGGHIDEQLSQEHVEHIFFGGNRLIPRPLMAESRFLRDHAALLSPRTLLVKKATLDMMDGAFSDACSSVMFRA